VVVGACNNPVLIDPAIIRPGRLDRHVRIPLPDLEARAAIFRMHLRGELPPTTTAPLPKPRMACRGAAIQQIVRDAAGAQDAAGIR
jgi:SpoVK/Ycf46/Vps4 family AAA+-type ATPase